MLSDENIYLIYVFLGSIYDNQGNGTNNIYKMATISKQFNKILCRFYPKRSVLIKCLNEYVKDKNKKLKYFTKAFIKSRFGNIGLFKIKEDKLYIHNLLQNIPTNRNYDEHIFRITIYFFSKIGTIKKYIFLFEPNYIAASIGNFNNYYTLLRREKIDITDIETNNIIQHYVKINKYKPECINDYIKINLS